MNSEEETEAFFLKTNDKSSDGESTANVSLRNLKKFKLRKIQFQSGFLSTSMKSFMLNVMSVFDQGAIQVIFFGKDLF